MRSGIKYLGWFALAVVVTIGATIAIVATYSADARPVDPDTRSCSCTEPDHYELISLEKGVYCYREQATVSVIIFTVQPANIVFPPELGWIEYGVKTGIPPTAVFWMGGTPDVTGTFLMSFDVVGYGHVHLEFKIWEMK